MTNDLLGLTAQIVSAHVQRNAVPADELASLIRDVHKALAGLDDSAVAAAEPRESAPATPAVLVTKSVFADYVVCLACGKRMTMLKRHLTTEHELTVDQYRAKYDLPSNYPMVAPNYAETRSKLAKKMGLGKSRSAGARKAGRPPGPKRGRG